MTNRTRLGLCCTLLASGLLAQSIVVPNSAATTATSTTGNTLLRTGPLTYQMGIAAAELAGLPVGAIITGVSLRAAVTASNPAAWPPSDASWPSYDITIGGAIPLGTWTGTFATNFAGAPVVARSGPLVVEAGSFPNTTTLPQPNAWGEFYWDFQQPFLYLGGDLAILFAHGNSSQTVTSMFFEYRSPQPNTVAYSASAYPATSGSTAIAFNVTRIHWGYGKGCPGTNGATPNLVLTNDVTGGGSATFAAANGLPGAPAGFVIGNLQTSIAMPFGCTLANNALVVVPTTLSNYGRAKLGGTFPAGVAGTICCQLFVLDAGAPTGIAGSLGAKLSVR